MRRSCPHQEIDNDKVDLVGDLERIETSAEDVNSATCPNDRMQTVENPGIIAPCQKTDSRQSCQDRVHTNAVFRKNEQRMDLIV